MRWAAIELLVGFSATPAPSAFESGKNLLIDAKVSRPVRSSERLKLQPNRPSSATFATYCLKRIGVPRIVGELRPSKAEEKPGVELVASNPG